MLQKKKKKASDAVGDIIYWLSTILLILLCLCMFVLGMYSMIDSYHVYNHASSNNLLKYKPDKNGNNEYAGEIDSVAWLTIDDTNIDYPVMQGVDNREYLNKDPFGNFALSGSLFLDYRNKSDFSDSFSLIYGHHMEHDTMFGALDEFKKEDYLAKHEHGELVVGSTTYNLQIFACITADAAKSAIFTPDRLDAQDVLQIINQSQNVKNTNISISNDDRILALSTCQGSASDDRTIVFCKIQ